ncbi:hypothetical protein DSCW_17680 [Desulfosarcina widdelii]|uniref:Uncharacterized protein n=1 Tax=Desulfosarcina widdelii TaxID=947919 RepID=A0A5K7Z446_9BACT|nr:hypothetical protein [Desulfosarcina widdelii]BBO74351.1 hypothetical protein DSCW_17680 [Desulfosarcina widdelii]
MKLSPLNEIIKADVEEVTKAILKDAVDPWMFFNSKGVQIKKVYGGSISISGVEYSGSAVLIFWNGFIDAYIKKRSRDLIETTRLKAIERNILVQGALESCRLHLHGMISQIFNRMAIIDQRLRGKGYPNSVEIKDVHKRIMQNCLVVDTLINSEIESSKNIKRKTSKWLNAFELKPNFFGMGINLNWLISKVFRKK